MENRDSIEMQLISIREAEESRASLIAERLIEKPKLSVMMIIFPLLFLTFVTQMKRYKLRREIFRKEYLFTRELVLEFLKTEEREKAAEYFRSKIFKNCEIENIEKLFEAQCAEAIEIYQRYEKILEGKDESLLSKEIKAAELNTLQISREIFQLDWENLEFSYKLEKILGEL